MEEIIYKLKTLQSIEPDEAWQADKKRKLLEKVSVFGVKNDIFLSSNDILSSNNIYSKGFKFNMRNLMPNNLAVSLVSIIVVLTSGVLTVGASQSSLPGETLYPVKKASEQVALAVASDQDKPKIEIEQAGKRLEELAKISEKASDSNQHEKVQQLMTEFQEKVDSASAHLSQLSDKGVSNSTANKAKVAETAKIVNEQSEKYTDVLQKTTDSLPQTVKDKVADKVAVAAKTTEKVNFTALVVMIDNTSEQDKDQVVAKVQETIQKTEAKVNEIAATKAAAADQQNSATMENDSKGSICSNDSKSGKTGAPENPVKDNVAENAATTEEAKKELEKAKENLKNNNLIDTVKSVAAANDIADTVAKVSNNSASSAGAASQPDAGSGVKTQ